MAGKMRAIWPCFSLLPEQIVSSLRVKAQMDYAQQEPETSWCLTESGAFIPVNAELSAGGQMAGWLDRWIVMDGWMVGR